MGPSLGPNESQIHHSADLYAVNGKWTPFGTKPHWLTSCLEVGLAKEDPQCTLQACHPSPSWRTACQLSCEHSTM